MIKGCRYDEVRSLYVKQLAYILVGDRDGETRRSVEKKIESFVEGDLEHAAETVLALWEVVKKDGDIKAPSSTVSAVSQLPVCILCRSAHST